MLAEVGRPIVKSFLGICPFSFECSFPPLAPIDPGRQANGGQGIQDIYFRRSLSGAEVIAT